MTAHTMARCAGILEGPRRAGFSLSPVFEASEAEQFGMLLDRLNAGEVAQANMERELYHWIWQVVAHKTGMRYGRTQN